MSRSAESSKEAICGNHAHQLFSYIYVCGQDKKSVLLAFNLSCRLRPIKEFSKVVVTIPTSARMKSFSSKVSFGKVYQPAGKAGCLLWEYVLYCGSVLSLLSTLFYPPSANWSFLHLISPQYSCPARFFHCARLYPLINSCGPP